MNEHQTELKAALDVLRESLAAKRPLNRYHARAILLPFGACLKVESDPPPAGSPPSAESPELGWVRAATRSHAQAWRAAVDDEMEMAVTELVHGADPRFLGRKDFDWRYADAARALLDLAKRVAGSDASVLISGESGGSSMDSLHWRAERGSPKIRSIPGVVDIESDPALSTACFRPAADRQCPSPTRLDPRGSDRRSGRTPGVMPAKTAERKGFASSRAGREGGDEAP